MLNARCKGITLIELLVAITIVIVLTVIAVPTFISLFQEYKVSTKTNSLYYFLQYARSAAVKNNQSVYVNFSPGSTWCYGINAGATCTCTTANSCGLGTTNSQDTTLTLSTTGLTSNTLVFDGTHGSASSSRITFTLTSGGTAMSVIIGALGNMYICSDQISGYSACP